MLCSQPTACTRADIVSAISDNPNWSNVTALVTALNATYLLPDQTGPGTLLLPTNRAFEALSELRHTVDFCQRRMTTFDLQQNAADGCTTDTHVNMYHRPLNVLHLRGAPYLVPMIDR